MALCICDSKKEYSICCEPLLTGSVKAKTVRQLVRSRYAAYAAGGQANYLMQTWHPSTASNIKAAELNTNSYTWDSLEILRHQQKGDYGQVEFVARYRDDEGIKKAHHETSLLQRVNGDWYYLNGQVANQA
ncbi:MAG: YchJ family metal-binding protein [Gammaproteobacteria bacterium]|jgi:SEC-C motif domain protein|nr:YchJ family metal-binding protein [Gammaproteobacteria bacterium]